MRARRRPFVDEYVEGRESAVMMDERILVLSPLATALLGAMEGGWMDLSDLAVHLKQVLGAPTDAVDVMEATGAAIRDLADEGVVDIED